MSGKKGSVRRDVKFEEIVIDMGLHTNSFTGEKDYEFCVILPSGLISYYAFSERCDLHPEYDKESVREVIRLLRDAIRRIEKRYGVTSNG